MTNTTRLSRLMRMSWEIQKSKHSSRAKALQSAWVILSNEDITVYYLVKKLSSNRQVKQNALNQFSIFNR